MPLGALRLLALDGGGVRGLSSLMILERLMEVVNPDAPPKPCDYFDMIGGTSTGGLIAIMLGRLQMTVEECIDAYLALSKKVFEKKAHRVNIQGKLQGRFSSQKLEEAVKEVLEERGLEADALLKDADAPCKVADTSETVCLSSYRAAHTRTDLLNSVKIWEACRATSAASTFFDSIAIGRYSEEFLDGATGANNPIQELWNEAQSVWGPEAIEGRVQCIVSIGTGVPPLKPFRDDLLGIGQTLAAISTETEQTAQRFQRDKSSLDQSGRYFRFNVIRGLEDIGLEESKKVNEMAAVTGRYLKSQDVVKQMQACAVGVIRKRGSGKYHIDFSLKNVPVTKAFVDRPAEMSKLEEHVLLATGKGRRKISVLRGMGGIGKTQLAVEFSRRHQNKFSAVFWLDGSSVNSLKQSLAGHVRRLPPDHISENSRAYSHGGSSDVDAVVEEMLGWLSRADNSSWLLIYDNVDREYNKSNTDSLAYDIKQYFPNADHGSILVTTRLARLEQLGDSQLVQKADKEISRAIFQKWYKKEYDEADGTRLFKYLDGLPLAIAQAGAYLQQSGESLQAYIRLYIQQWKQLPDPQNVEDTYLDDYTGRSVETTWTISYNAILAKDECAANLLLLWSHIDSKDVWFEMFQRASQDISFANVLSKWLKQIPNQEIAFNRAVGLLHSYSLIEESEIADGYSMHAVVHRWAYHYQTRQHRKDLGRLAISLIGSAVPSQDERDYSHIQRRLIPHAQACFNHITTVERYTSKNLLRSDNRRKETASILREPDFWGAVHNLGALYYNQGKLDEAEQMYIRALQGYEKALGRDHTSTLSTANNLGALYYNQGKLDKAEQMYIRALQGYEKALGRDHTSTLNTVNNLGLLYSDQGKLDEAEQMYIRALQGQEKALGRDHTSTLNIVGNLGSLYRNQGKLDEAEQMYIQALQGFEKALGPNHTSTLKTVSNLGNIYHDQGKLNEAEQMYNRALRGYEKALGPDHASTLLAKGNMSALMRR